MENKDLETMIFAYFSKAVVLKMASTEAIKMDPKGMQEVDDCLKDAQRIATLIGGVVEFEWGPHRYQVSEVGMVSREPLEPPINLEDFSRWADRAGYIFDDRYGRIISKFRSGDVTKEEVLKEYKEFKARTDEKKK